MIGSRLRAARIRANKSQEELGVKAGLDESTARSRVSQYESGHVSPPFNIACNFADVLGVPECYFYIRDPEFAEEVLDLFIKKKERGKLK
jgi:transcriptional regulator with XRE-family HTH domain